MGLINSRMPNRPIPRVEFVVQVISRNISDRIRVRDWGTTSNNILGRDG